MLADPEGKSGGPLHVRLSFQPQQGIVPAPPLFAYNGQPFCIRESPPSIQAYATVSLFLPLSRRAFSTRRPPLVLIRDRKPCSRRRGILLG